jgi:cysteine desulfurase/selenocysteine lyase
MSASPRIAGSASPPAFDVERVRGDFPILTETVHGKPLVYLDSAASAQKPTAVLDAVRRFDAESYSNIHRGVHLLSERATDAYEQARGTLQRFLGAADPSEVVFVRGTTEGINLVASSWGRKFLQAGDEVVITTMEHHSNIVPWQILRDEIGIVLRVVPVNDDGELLLDELERMLGPRTRLVSVVHLSNALGTVNPVARIVEMAHERGALVLVDGAQSAPHLAVDVTALGCDFYVFSGHKLYGPTGIGVLYGRREHLESMPPYQSGGGMIRSVSFEQTLYAKPPARFEAGTPNITGAVGLGAAADYLDGLGREAVARHEHELLEFATERVRRIPEVRLIGNAQDKAGVLSFLVEGVHAHDVGTILDQSGVAIRVGHHCTQPLMQRLGVAATARASFGLYNTRGEVEALVRGIENVLEVFA